MDVSTVGGRGASALSSSPRDLAAVRLGGVAGLVAGALMIAHQVADTVIGGRTTDGPRALLHTAWLIALFLTVWGVRVLQRPVADRVAEILLGITLAGVGGTAVAAAAEAVSRLTGAGSSTEDPPMPVLVVLIGLLALLTVGLLGLAVAVLRAHVLPRSVGLVLLLCVLVKMFAPEPVPSLAILGLAVAWLAFAMLRGVAAGTSAVRE
jgi:hypothetical protein